MKEIILASGSPRRKELLSLIEIPYRVIKSNADENCEAEKPQDLVKELAFRKAAQVGQKVKDGIILGADTIVCLDDQILGKPVDREDAYRMIHTLQGRSHSVYTGVALICMKDGQMERKINFAQETIVHVHTMTDQEIERYLDTGDAFDKAGSYGIQGPFAAWVDGIEGDYQNVVGLPIAAVYQALMQLGA